MAVKGGLFVLIVTALVVRSSSPIRRGCNPSGFLHFEPFMTFGDAEDTELLGFYILHSPKKPRKLDCCEKLWHKRSLILMLLLLAGIETNPDEFTCVLFLSAKAALFRLKCTKVSKRLLVNFEHYAVPEIRIEKPP